MVRLNRQLKLIPLGYLLMSSLLTTVDGLFIFNAATIIRLGLKFLKRDSSACYPYVGCFRRNETFRHVSVLPDSPAQVRTRFLLYTKRNPTLPEILYYEKPESILRSRYLRPKNKLKIIIHGYAESSFIKKLISMKNAFLRLEEDFNVIMVDWREGAHLSNYLYAAVNSELVGRQTAYFVSQLIKLKQFSPKNIHAIGFSLGAHITGQIGRQLKKWDSITIARISALDPAATLFIGYGNDIHLTKDDADYVDVIHTSYGHNLLSGSVGINKPIGHVDYYPNGGYNQPGCHFLFGFYCDHFRAVYLFTESILSTCAFRSNTCGPRVAYHQCKACTGLNNTCGRMGYFSDVTQATGSQYLDTNSKFPYCLKRTT